MKLWASCTSWTINFFLIHRDIVAAAGSARQADQADGICRSFTFKKDRLLTIFRADMTTSASDTIERDRPRNPSLNEP
jgi:hypothetical protein